ncbi:hypothetical protein HPS_0958 [Glaesserella parasuis 29755]|nr:hypothetical protein HPS_0958 [Glaesserella parasuis 29755]
MFISKTINAYTLLYSYQTSSEYINHRNLINPLVLEYGQKKTPLRVPS